ncbi:UNVERIFIED_CONTAM: hypothetical protein NCL1_12191 [Trichonephila clavipes]
MLADPHLPAHVVGGLRSLASLLSPPSQVGVNHRIQRPGGASVSLADFNSGSDNEEIPYTGEKPSALSKISQIQTTLAGGAKIQPLSSRGNYSLQISTLRSRAEQKRALSSRCNH